MSAQYRVKAFTKRVPAGPGYVGTDEVHIQQLEVKTRIGWQVIDEEEVPSHVRISIGCFGDTGGWTSKFTSVGTFGRDGVVAQ